MRLSDYRDQGPQVVITRQVALASLFLQLSGCQITGVSNPPSAKALMNELPAADSTPEAKPARSAGSGTRSNLH